MPAIIKYSETKSIYFNEYYVKYWFTVTSHDMVYKDVSLVYQIL